MRVWGGRRAAVYVFLCAVWGSTWLAIKIGLRDLPPLRFAGMRMALACVLLAPFAFRRQGVRPTRRQAVLIAFAGFLQIGLSYAFVFTATQWIESGLAALLFSSFPIWVGLFAHYQLADEPLTFRTLAAAAVGLAGVAVIEAPALGRIGRTEGRALLLGGGLMLASAVVSAYANVLNKRRFADVSPPLNVWGQTLVGSAALLLASFALERGLPSRWTPDAVAALFYLAVFGTALTFVGLFWLIPRVPVAVIGTIPLVDTLLAVALGAAVLNERLSPRVLAGGALILLGVASTVLSGGTSRRTSGAATARAAGTREARNGS
jgi:drug/metabolite transporter (DMT)-like permease